ncbi:rho guanine nucleotide exchange factor 9-like [Heterodontus francisci]|uniref:rho guanine nucleotide exchange factor 9-like n=1 Tax=Heterodontus francisci TaxID=7792 RepID=UPI00355B8630
MQGFPSTGKIGPGNPVIEFRGGHYCSDSLLPSNERGTIEFLDISEEDIIPPPEPRPQPPPQPPPKPPPKPPPARPASPKLTQRDQRRANIITEIINSEKEYVKNLRDIHEGYYKQCQKTKDLFPHARLKTLFSNIGDIYKMHKRLLQSLEKKYKAKQPHLSEFGSCFLDQSKGFLLYAEYCKNHVNALEEWARLIVVEKYAYFFEVCRLHQQMMSLPLDGFLIMPVQKICKYPLLLMELLKATLPEHRDYRNVEAAVIGMKSVLNAINIEKGEDEIEDKILRFQKSILDWQGEDLSVISTQLIQRGDLIVVPRPHARAKHFMAFLLDHQMILCKKDLLRRNMLYYKERIDIDQHIVMDVEDGREEEFDCKVKNAIKFKSKFDDEPSKLLFTKSLADKQLWLHAFEEERKISEGERDAAINWAPGSPAQEGDLWRHCAGMCQNDLPFPIKL